MRFVMCRETVRPSLKLMLFMLQLWHCDLQNEANIRSFSSSSLRACSAGAVNSAWTIDADNRNYCLRQILQHRDCLSAEIGVHNWYVVHRRPTNEVLTFCNDIDGHIHQASADLHREQLMKPMTAPHFVAYITTY